MLRPPDPGATPGLLLLVVGTSKTFAGPLHRESELVQQRRDVMVVVLDPVATTNSLATPIARDGRFVSRV